MRYPWDFKNKVLSSGTEFSWSFSEVYMHSLHTVQQTSTHCQHSDIVFPIQVPILVSILPIPYSITPSFHPSFWTSFQTFFLLNLRNANLVLIPDLYLHSRIPVLIRVIFLLFLTYPVWIFYILFFPPFLLFLTHSLSYFLLFPFSSL